MASTASMILAIAAIVVAAAFIEDKAEASNLYEQCQGKLEERPLHACRQLLEKKSIDRFQVLVPGVQLCSWQQLRDLSQDFRCEVLRWMVRDYKEELLELEVSEEEEETGYYGGSTTTGTHGSTHMRWTHVWEFSVRLRSMCGISPQYCSIFSSSD